MAVDSPSSNAARVLAQRVQSLRLGEETRAPRRRTALPWYLVGMMAVAVGVLLARDAGRVPAAGNSAADSAKAAVGTVAGTSQPAPTPVGGPDEKVLESKGYLIAKQQILITPKVNGRIERLFVEEGQHVKKDDTLAILERDEYVFDRDTAKAKLAEALARLDELKNGYQEEEMALVAADRAEADTNSKQAELSYRRLQELRESRNASPQDMDQAESTHLAAKARANKLKSSSAILLRRTPTKVAAATATASQARADLEHAQYRLDSCVVKSPIDGIILTKKAEEGNVVNPIAFAGSTSICEIADVGKLEVDLKVMEADFAKVYDGQPCRVVAVAYPERTYSGTVRRMPIADRTNGAVPVRIAVVIPAAEVGVYLRPEMGANVSFLRGRPPAPVAPPSPQK